MSRDSAFRYKGKEQDAQKVGWRIEDVLGAGDLDFTRPFLPDRLAGIAAPHVSPEGGWNSYQAAYGALAPEYKDRTFVVLGTSHYGQPERFGMTRKPFVTPLG